MKVDQIICGDCLEVMDAMKPGSIDMVMTDPPYGTTACKWDSIIPLEPMWEQLKRLIKPNGAIVMTASQPFTTTLIASNMKMFKYCWVWEKEQGSNFFMAKKQPLKSHEDVIVFCSGQPTYNPQMTDSGKAWKKKDTGKTYNAIVGHQEKQHVKQSTGTLRYPKTVQQFCRPKQGSVHPTQKPVALMEYLIKTYTNEGELVLDFTCGSGTTCVAAKNLGRHYIGIEQDEKYCKIARKRIEDMAGLF